VRGVKQRIHVRLRTIAKSVGAPPCATFTPGTRRSLRVRLLSYPVPPALHNTALRSFIHSMLHTHTVTHTHAHTHPFIGIFSGTTRVSRYQKGKTNLDFTEARESEWQWHQLGRMQVCTLLQTDNHASAPLLSFLQTGCPSCQPTASKH